MGGGLTDRRGLPLIILAGRLVTVHRFCDAFEPVYASGSLNSNPVRPRKRAGVGHLAGVVQDGPSGKPAT
jgi:hypothetical protein